MTNTKITLPRADDAAFRIMLELCQNVRHKLEQETPSEAPKDFPAAALFTTGMKAYIDLYGRQRTAELLRDLSNALDPNNSF